MATEIEDILRQSPLLPKQKAMLWYAYEQSPDLQTLTSRLELYPDVPKKVKALLYYRKRDELQAMPKATTPAATPERGFADRVVDT
ncbi:MAG: hypothetical protein ABIH23_18565, partial [bacterium]